MSAQQIIISKVQDHHTRKIAYHYIRQSSDKQVRQNTGSTQVQIDMHEHAVAYGFPPENIKTVVRDQARSGKSIENRDGFKEMLVDIAMGNVGAVFCSHSSRLARNARDMQQLTVLCEATRTLIIDEHNVYDPQNESDRFFLDIKGVFDEAEGRRIKSLMWNSLIAKAKKGQFHIHLPVGFVWSGPGDDAKILFEPDELVQNAVRQIFDLLVQLGSAGAVARYINENKIFFPTRVRVGSHQEGKYELKPLSLTRLSKIYCNPVYAGAYVFGKFRIRSVMDKDSAEYEAISLSPPNVRRRVVRVKPEEWEVYIPNNHQGYIDMARFEENQKILKDNRWQTDGGTRGAVRDGAALLTGIVFCGHCGTKMSVKYPKRQKSYYYRCQGGKRTWGEKGICQSTSCIPVDEVITQQLLEAFNESQLEMALESAKYIEMQAQKKIRDLQLCLKQAQFEEEEAKDRYMRVNHRNRLVAESLESEWEMKKAELNRVKNNLERASKTAHTLLGASEHDAVLSLAGDIPSLWNSKRMTNVLRKRILRLLVNQVFLSRVEGSYKIRIHWRTGICTEASTPVREAKDYNQTDPKVVELIQSLAPHKTDKGIAEHLNDLGIKPRHKEYFTYETITGIRWRYDISNSLSARSEKHFSAGQNTDGLYTVAAVAELLNYKRARIIQWCRQGKIDAIQHSTRGMWWIKLNPEDIERLKRNNFSRELGEDLTDAQWEHIAPSIPVSPRSDDGHGKPRRGYREIINAILWKLRSYARWMDLPERFPATTIYNRRYKEWLKNGVLAQVIQTLAEELRLKGEVDLSRCYLEALSMTTENFRPRRTGKAIFMST